MKSLKDSISYSQALTSKRIYTTSKDFEHHYKELKQRFIEEGYKSELLDKHIKTVEKLDRNVNKKRHANSYTHSLSNNI